MSDINFYTSLTKTKITFPTENCCNCILSDIIAHFDEHFKINKNHYLSIKLS